MMTSQETDYKEKGASSQLFWLDAPAGGGDRGAVLVPFVIRETSKGATNYLHT